MDNICQLLCHLLTGFGLNVGSVSANILEVVSKPPLRPNFCVGPRDSIFEISNIFLRLNPSRRLDLEPD